MCQSRVGLMFIVISICKCGFKILNLSILMPLPPRSLVFNELSGSNASQICLYVCVQLASFLPRFAGDSGEPGLLEVMFQVLLWWLPITPSNYAALEGILYCKHHFSQLVYCIHTICSQTHNAGPTCILYLAEEVFDFHGLCLTFSFLLKCSYYCSGQ